MAVQPDTIYGPAQPSPRPYVLNFQGPATVGGAGSRVNCGPFWNLSAASSSAQIGSARCSFLAKPRALLLQYVVSAGAGGAHPALYGFNPLGDGVGLAIQGDIQTAADGSSAHSFQTQACDSLPINAYHIVDAAIDLTGTGNGWMTVHVDGVCCYATTFVGNRFSGVLGTDGNLYIGGSDHLNFQGLLAWVNMWDCNKLALPNGSTFTTANAFRPARTLLPWQGVPTLQMPDFSLDCTIPGAVVPDVACGLAGVTSASVNYRGTEQHNGLREYSLSAGGREGTPRLIPEWVEDSTCDAWIAQYPFAPPGVRLGSTQSVPASAKVWDDFSLKYQTYRNTEYPKLGTTSAAGSLGAKTWNVRPDTTTNVFAWGIYSGYATFLGDGQNPNSPAWVTGNSGDMDVRIEVPIGCDAGRRAGYFMGPGVCFRVGDIDNGWVFWVEEDRKGQLRSYNSGVPTDVGAQVTVVANFTWLRAVTSGTSITIYSGTGAQGSQAWTVATTATSSYLQSSTGAGFVSRGGSLTRIKNFVVL